VDKHEQVLEMFGQGKSRKEIADSLDMSYDAVKKVLLRDKWGGSTKGKIVYEDKREYTDDDLDRFISTMKQLQKDYQAVNTKQTKATVTIDDDKPVGIALWGDWHEGGIGVDYDRLDADTEKIINTDGMYWIGLGDYKDNFITGTHPGAQFEQIIQPGMQDLLVKRRMERCAEGCLALVRGCHDDWDKKSGDKDFIQSMCEVTNAVNLWHGGDLYIKFGASEYHFKCRHKYKFESSINPENAMRRIMEMQGPCDVAASAHLHNPYYMDRHLMGEYRVLCRTGSYKTWDEFSQKIGGYKGKANIPVIILFPDRKFFFPLYLNEAITVLKSLRGNECAAI